MFIIVRSDSKRRDSDLEDDEDDDDEDGEDGEEKREEPERIKKKPNGTKSAHGTCSEYHTNKLESGTMSEAWQNVLHGGSPASSYNPRPTCSSRRC